MYVSRKEGKRELYDFNLVIQKDFFPEMNVFVNM